MSFVKIGAVILCVYIPSPAPPPHPHFILNENRHKRFAHNADEHLLVFENRHMEGRCCD